MLVLLGGGEGDTAFFLLLDVVTLWLVYGLTLKGGIARGQGLGVGQQGVKG